MKKVASRGRLGLVACSALAAAAFAMPSSASAAVTCNLAGGVLTVEVTGTGTPGIGDPEVAAVRMTNGGQDVQVSDTINFSNPVPCGGATPTQANTNSITITDTEPGAQRTIGVVSLAGGPFVNADTTGEGAGTQEIEITFEGGNEASDDLVLNGGPSGVNDNWRMGQLAGDKGYQLDDAEPAAAADVDDVVTTNVEALQVGINGNPGNDILDARGGTGFTAPLTATSTAQLVGGLGDDQIFAGNGNGWHLEGDDGADALTGGPGNDQLRFAFGTNADTGDGNGGTDSCSYLNHGAGVNVDLRITDPQNTGGAGTDTISDCENLVGGSGADTLIGTSGPNNISAQAGNDALIGLGGDDVLTGGADIDTVSYAQGSTSAVAVNLATVVSQNTGGAGNDTITTMENLTGSQFSDTLTGDGSANTIDAYDGALDTVNCAGGTDTAIADEIGVDTLTDCETIDNAPRVSVGPTPADGALLNDPTPAYALAADEAASFEVSVDGGAFTACAASCEPPALSDGPHTLEFRAVDTDENLHPGLDSASRTVTVDTVAPDVQVVDGPAASTEDTTPTFGFTAAGALTVECRVDGDAFGACSGPGSSHTTGILPEGAHTFEVRGVDAAGNSATAIRAFTVVAAADNPDPPDTAAPETTITKVKVRGDRATLRFSSTEAGSSFVCKLDKRPLRPCRSPAKFKNLKEGRHKVKVFATDAAGNKDASPAKAKFRIG